MNPLSEIIRREVAPNGILPFARFMELALYCPKHGYYETKKDNPGRHGDFYTSVATGEVFGQLLACRFAGWLDEIKTLNPQPSTLNLIEAGAHDGTLARDILSWLQLKRPELFGQIEYCIIEPSAQRQAWQRETLKDFTPHVRWIGSFQNISSKHLKWNGVIFSNELLDAMPVHRFGWDAVNKAWFEWGVAVDGGKFIWAKIPGSVGVSPASRKPKNETRRRDAGAPRSFMDRAGARGVFEKLPPELLAVLPDGYTIETCPAAEDWWRDAANVLERGKLMTIDYGLTVEELFSPGRLRGTLRAYFRHHVTDDVLANVGEQDLTAHVNFSAIQSAGESAGLETETFSTQSQFLTRILGNALKDGAFGGWNVNQARQFQTLTHPEHLGRAFRVLVQTR